MADSALGARVDSPLPPEGGRRHWSLSRWLQIFWVLSVASAAVAILSGALGLTQLSVARTTLIDQLDPALLNAQDLATALVNQETGVRGFAATGDQTFLVPYKQGLRQETDASAALDRLGTGNSRPELAAELTEIRALASAWRADYATPTITAVRALGPSGASVDPTVGKAKFDALRTALDRQRTGLTQARDNARNILGSTAGTLVAICIIIGVGLLGIFISIGFWARRIVTNPILGLGAEVRAVASGEFDRQVHGQGFRELVRLGEDIEKMRRQIVYELTRVQTLNKRMEIQSAELERSNFDLEQFAYVASHDLQEPLRKVSSFCELLAKRYAGELDERADQYIHFAVDGARRMSVLINDLLAFSRAGRTTDGKWEKLDCEALLAQALRNLTEAVNDSEAHITHDPLPTVLGEKSLLATVFQNLIGNAIKFRAEDPPLIHVSAQLDNDSWLFRISDNGIGIDPAYKEKIFVIFQRLHGKDAYPGTGIGLALCRKIIEYHRGKVWLAPDVTPGTTFCFTLPATTEESEEIIEMTSPATARTAHD